MSPSGRSSSKGSSRSTEKSGRSTLPITKKATNSPTTAKLTYDPSSKSSIIPNGLSNATFTVVPVSKGFSQLASSLYPSVSATLTTHSQQFTSSTIPGGLIKLSSIKESWGTPLSMIPNGPPIRAPTATLVRGSSLYAESTTGYLVPLQTTQTFNTKINPPPPPHTIMRDGKPTQAITLHSCIHKSAIIPASSAYNILPKHQTIWNVSTPNLTSSAQKAPGQNVSTQKTATNKLPPVICITTPKEGTTSRVNQLIQSTNPPRFYCPTQEILHLTPVPINVSSANVKPAKNPTTISISEISPSAANSSLENVVVHERSGAKVIKELGSEKIAQSSTVENTVNDCVARCKRAKKTAARYVTTSNKMIFKAAFSNPCNYSKKSISFQKKRSKTKTKIITVVNKKKVNVVIKKHELKAVKQKPEVKAVHRNHEVKTVNKQHVLKVVNKKQGVKDLTKKNEIKAVKKKMKIEAANKKHKSKVANKKHKLKASNKKQEVKDVNKKQEVKAVNEKQEVKAANEKQGVKAANEKQEVKAVNKKQEVKAANEKQEVKAVNEKNEVRVVNKKQEVKAVNEKQAVKTVSDKPAVKAVTEKPAVKAVTEKSAVKAVTEKETVKAVNEKQKVKAVNKKPKVKAVNKKQKLKAAKKKKKVKLNKVNRIKIKSPLIPTYKVNGKEPLFIQKSRIVVFNKNLLVHNKVKPASISKRIASKIRFKAIKCYADTSESEDETPFVLPKLKRPLPSYDFKNNIIKRRKISNTEVMEVDDEANHCEMLYQIPTPFVNAFTREEERFLKREKLKPKNEVKSKSSSKTERIPPKSASSSGVQIIYENIRKTVRNDPVIVTSTYSGMTITTTNSLNTFHLPVVSSSTATTNVTQVTNTPIVSSFVKEPIASTSKAAASNSSIPVCVEKSNDPQPSPARSKIQEESSISSAKSNDVQSLSKDKSKDSPKSKSKDGLVKGKSKGASTQKNKSKDNSPVKGKPGDIVASTSKNIPGDEAVVVEKVKSAKSKKSASKNAKGKNPAATAAPSNEASTKDGTQPSTSTPNNTGKSKNKAINRAPKPNPGPYDFGTDIKNIMQAFGDCEDQNMESVHLMEIILREELNGFIYICENAANATGVESLQIREAVFALRREKPRLGRLFRYFKTKENRKASRQLPNQVNKETIVTYEAELREIIDEVDETGELSRLFENGPETALRDCELRADRVVQRLTMPKFLMYSKARSISYARKMPRLSEWVADNLHSRRVLSLAFIDILGFLIYEIVSEVMNMAMSVRSERLATTMFERMMDNRGLNPDTCMSDPAFLKKRCFGLQNVSEILVQAGELQAMRFKKSETRTLNFNSEHYKQILPLDIRDGYLRFANEHLLEPSLSYKCEARRVACKSKIQRGLDREEMPIKPYPIRDEEKTNDKT